MFLGTWDFNTGIKLHIPNLSDVTISQTSGEGTTVGIGFSAEKEFKLVKKVLE